MSQRQKTFRVQFIDRLAHPDRSGTLGEGDVRAADINEALWASADICPPAAAQGRRVIDPETGEVAYSIDADANRSPRLIVKIS